MKYRLAVLLLLIIATLSQDTITQLGKEKPEIEETQQNNSTKSTQELLASIPNHNKPVLLLNPGKYANSSSLLGIENQIQRSTENYLSKNEPATYSLEINQQKRLQKNNKLAQQKQESKKGEKEALKKQKEVIVDEAEKKLAKVLEQQKSLKNLDDKEISKHKMAEKTKKLEQSQAQEKTTNKKSPKYSRANKIVKNAKSQAISNFSESKQAKKEKNQTLQAMKQTKNDIKIIPLSSQYGKNRPRSEGNLQKSSASSKKAENLSQKTDEKTKSLLKAAQTRLDQKLNKKQEISNQNMKQNAAELSIKQSQKLQKLIQQVKNTKQQLPQKSKKQIIQYLQTKKKQKASQDQQQSQVTQTIILNQQISQKKEESQYALVVDEVIEISQQTKQSSKQMNNSTISVIMILTIFISIPIVKEIRSRNDQDQQLKADKGNDMMASNEKLQKTSDQKYYDELNNQSGEEVGQRIYEEII